jgi:hypothetical protein
LTGRSFGSLKLAQQLIKAVKKFPSGLRRRKYADLQLPRFVNDLGKMIF